MGLSENKVAQTSCNIPLSIMIFPIGMANIGQLGLSPWRPWSWSYITSNDARCYIVYIYIYCIHTYINTHCKTHDVSLYHITNIHLIPTIINYRYFMILLGHTKYVYIRNHPHHFRRTSSRRICGIRDLSLVGDG